MGLSLVIFDCDGVLIDSEPIANRIFSEQLAKIGLHMTPEEVWRVFVGNSRDRCIEMAGEIRGEPLPEGFAKMWDDALHRALDVEARPVEGVPELLRSLPVPCCVASNGEPTHMQRGLGAAGLMPFVEGRLFSAAEVAHPKPAPDVYLHAARRMGVPPARCAVVEDTPTGARAGLAAGMRVFAYVGSPMNQRAELERLGATPFTHMRELPRLLGFA
ncbi:MAG TPA: HAD family hydrolase [Usitatibacter sp.]|nr:HAD family hydrolase [Usitatibacter sp.]